MRNSHCVWQAVLASVRGQRPEDEDPDTFDWSSVSTDDYLQAVERLVPQVEDDPTVTDRKELRELEYKKLEASTMRQDLLNVFDDARRSRRLSSVRMGYLLDVRPLCRRRD